MSEVEDRAWERSNSPSLEAHDEDLEFFIESRELSGTLRAASLGERWEIDPELEGYISL